MHHLWKFSFLFLKESENASSRGCEGGGENIDRMHFLKVRSLKIALLKENLVVNNKRKRKLWTSPPIWVPKTAMLQLTHILTSYTCARAQKIHEKMKPGKTCHETKTKKKKIVNFLSYLNPKHRHASITSSNDLPWEVVVQGRKRFARKRRKKLVSEPKKKRIMLICELLLLLESKRSPCFNWCA